jgi:3'(2'), 5'-bisphosphate nucleotidase
MIDLGQYALIARDVCPMAIEAGRIIMQYYTSPHLWQTAYKADNSPVTQADKAAHNYLYAALSSLNVLDGSIPVLSEEGEAVPFAVRREWAAYWCVDPLDGTREFLARNDEFAVSIALITQQRPVIGVIYSPVLQQGVVAWQGGGAYAFQAAQPLGLAQISCQKPCATPLRIMLSRHYSPERLAPLAQYFGAIEIMPQGSAYKFAALASGRCDMILRLSATHEWDNAAGQCIIEEAGGAICAKPGQSLSYNQSDSLIQDRFIAVGDKNIQIHSFLSKLKDL